MSIVPILSHQHCRAVWTDHSSTRAAMRIYAFLEYILTLMLVLLALLLCIIGGMVFMLGGSRAALPDLRDFNEPEASDEVIPQVRNSVPPDLEVSPLHQILKRDLWNLQSRDESEGQSIKEKMQRMATVEESSLVISETVFPHEDQSQLVQFIGAQMDASKVSKNQADAVKAMIHLNSSEILFLHAETGKMGKLKNSLLLALYSRKKSNLHFMMVAMEVEAHLGWRIISSRERSTWNQVMKESLQRRLIVKIQRALNLGAERQTRDQSSNITASSATASHHSFVAPLESRERHSHTMSSHSAQNVTDVTIGFSPQFVARFRK